LASAASASASGRPGDLRVWDVTANPEHVTEPKVVYALAFSPDSGSLFLAANAVRTWDLTTGQLGRTFGAGLGPVVRWERQVFSGDGQRFAASERGRVRVWSTAGSEELLSFQAHDGPLDLLALSPDGRRLVFSARGARVHIWDTDAGKELLAFALPA